MQSQERPACDAEGLSADAKASVVAQRLLELTQGQEAVLGGGLLWDRLGVGELGRVMQSLSE